jgi:exopolyphosphatase/guanosine-5'-triphosphate,3'-diphosphate pyrophosphatase
MENRILAAIDIGSNGARLLIKRFWDDARGNSRIRKIMFIRVPLRLGKDVFSEGKISKERALMTLRMMKGFKQFMRMNGVEAYRACATSAMRDAENGKKLLKEIEKGAGIRLEIIKGEEEARLLCNNLLEKTDSNAGNFMSTPTATASPPASWTRT